MVEFFRHITGACGEHYHPNIFTMLTSLPLIGTGIYWVRDLIK